MLVTWQDLKHVGAHKVLFCYPGLHWQHNNQSSLALCGYAYVIMLLLCCSLWWLKYQHGVFCTVLLLCYVCEPHLGIKEAKGIEIVRNGMQRFWPAFLVSQKQLIFGIYSLFFSVAVVVWCPRWIIVHRVHWPGCSTRKQCYWLEVTAFNCHFYMMLLFCGFGTDNRTLFCFQNWHYIWVHWLSLFSIFVISGVQLLINQYLRLFRW